MACYTVTVPVLPGCITEGEAFEEAAANAREAISGFIRVLTHNGQPIPQEPPDLVVAVVEVDAAAIRCTATGR